MTDYFVSPSGSDDGSGRRDAPWRTLERVNRAGLVPGDRILLEGGATHPGYLMLRTASLRVSSYGSGRARIDAGNGGGILVWNAGHVKIEGLEVVGDGPAVNRADGICLFSDGDVWCDDVTVEDVDVSGFGRSGVAIGTRGRRGFRTVMLRSIESHHNGYAGILCWGPERDYAHEDLTIRHSEVHDNCGIPGLLQANGHGIHSGQGILVSSLKRGLIHDCRAHHNGELNTAHQCGPAGIWASNADQVHIRRNESYANRTAAATDGGGFGLDGGVSGSTLEDNYSHDNDGPGFQLAQFFGARPCRGNRVTGNRSENDARRNDHGALQLWAADDHCLEQCVVAGNTISLTPARYGRPRALSILGQTRDLEVVGNQFHVQGIALALQVDPQEQAPVFRDNVLDGDASLIWWYGQRYHGISAWLSALSGEDRRGWSRPSSISTPRWFGASQHADR